MSLYPSLEDMKADQLIKAQNEAFIAVSNAVENNMQVPAGSGYPISNPAYADALYPDLFNYMGLELSSNVIKQNMPEYSEEERNMQIATMQSLSMVPQSNTSNMVAPLSSQSAGLQRAGVTNGVRQVVLCKDAKGKVGIRVKAVNTGVFICLVQKASPAAIAGLRFGDQILQLNGENVAGYSMDKVHKIFREVPVNGIVVAVRDRPFERTVTLHKDSSGHIGFMYREGKINKIVQDSSAARNGLLTEHNLLEVNGQNVIGIKDKEITKIIDEGGNVITITVMPTFLFTHMIKSMATDLWKKSMDHSVPDI